MRNTAIHNRNGRAQLKQGERQVRTRYVRRSRRNSDITENRGAMNGDGDNEAWLTGWEQQCADEIEEQPDYEQTFISETDSSHRKIWTAFQDSATAIAQLYRGWWIGAAG